MTTLADIPTQVGYALGMTNADTALFVGGLVLSSAVLMSIILVMSYASRGKQSNILGQIIVLFSVMGILTAITWLPVWVLVVSVLAVVALFSGVIANIARR